MIQYIENTNLAYCDGYKFRKDKKTGYWLCTTLRKRLHIYIWEKYNGKIPKGYDIHHVDHDKDNNEISNLKMLKREEHRELHSRELTDERRQKMRDNLNKNARPKAIEWHKSDEAKEFHKEQYKISLGKLKPEKMICLNCNKEYYSINHNNNKFCCNACKSKYRRKSGVDNEIRICKNCGEKFETNKYSKVKTCSRHCSMLLKWKNKKIC